MLGVWGNFVIAPDADLHKRWSISPVIRLTPHKYGWGPVVGLNWYSGEIEVALDGGETLVGRLRLRPVMAGIGYATGRGKMRTTVNLMTGYAFNSASAEPNLPAARTATVSVSNAWVIRPSVGFTYALTRRLAIVSSLGYIYMNPTVKVTVSAGGQPVYQGPGDYRADHLNFTIGTAFSFF
jgi:hypothetical protein